MPKPLIVFLSTHSPDGVIANQGRLQKKLLELCSIHNCDLEIFQILEQSILIQFKIKEEGNIRELVKEIKHTISSMLQPIKELKSLTIGRGKPQENSLQKADD